MALCASGHMQNLKLLNTYFEEAAKGRREITEMVPASCASQYSLLKGTHTQAKPETLHSSKHANLHWASFPMQCCLAMLLKTRHM